MFGEYIEADAYSPGRAFARRQEAEIQLFKVTDAASLELRQWAAKQTALPPIAEIRRLWIEAVDNSLRLLSATEEAEAWAREEIVRLELPADVHEAMRLLFDYASQADLPIGELLEEYLLPEDERALVAAGWDDVLSPSRSRRSPIDAIIDAPRPPLGEIEPPSWLPSSDWAWRSARDSRTLATSFQASMALRRLRSRGNRRKRWVTRHDSKVRETHAAADRQVKRLEEPFVVGGELLMYPADTAGSPALTLNCRCVLVGLKRGESVD